MSWKIQPDQSGVYYISVYNQSSTRCWRYKADNDHWINLETFQSDDSFKWKLDQVSGETTWRITPFADPSIGMGASPTRRANGDGMYWFHGFAQGKRGPSAAWRITPDTNWSTVSIDYNVLDSRMEGAGGRNAGGCVHFYRPGYGDPTNQRWVFQRAETNSNSNDGSDGGGNNNNNNNNNGGGNGGGNNNNKGTGKTFEDIWFPLTPQDAGKEKYDIIIVGTGMGAGVISGDLFDTNSKVGHRSKSILVIEKGGVPFHSHCFNAARPIGFGEDRGQQNDTFFDLFKQSYTYKTETQANEWKAGEMFNLGGRGAAWGLFSPRIHDETLEKQFGTGLRQELVGEWYRKAEDLMGLFNPKTNSYHASLMERLNMVSKSEHRCQWQWGRIASEFQDERNFDFARGAYSPIDKLLEIAMSKDRDSKTRQTIEHEKFKILIHSDVRSLELDPDKDDVFSGVWVRDRTGKDTLIKLKANGKIILGAGSIGSPTILMRTSNDLANRLKRNGGLHLTDHDIFAATANFGYLDMSVQEKVGPMKLQTYVRLKSQRIALLNVAVAASSFLPRTSFPQQQRYTNTEYPRMIAAFIFPEALVESNTIELTKTPKRRDAEPIVDAGRRQPFNFSPEDKADIAELRELTKKVFRTLQDELKLYDMHVLDPGQPQDGRQVDVTDDNYFKVLELGGVAHELGTIPMRNGSGTDSSRRFCVDENLLLRDTSNLYVCDLSVFPYSPEVNPTLTLVALALRLSRHIHDPRVINTSGGYWPGASRWVMNQTGDPIKVHISNLSGVPSTKRIIDGKEEADTGDTILEPGGILEVGRDNKTDETVRVYKLRFGIDWEKWKNVKVPANPFLTLPLQYIARAQKVCAIE